MKPRILSLLLVAAVISLMPTSGWSQSDSVPSPILHPNKGLIPLPYADEEGKPKAIGVTFATPMVDIDLVRRPSQSSPIVFAPAVEFHWTWLSQSEGKIEFIESETGRGMPRITYVAKLRPKLKDLDGKLVGTEVWSVEYADTGFALTSVEIDHLDFIEPDKDGKFGDDGIDRLLSARPRVRLEFTRDVGPEDLARTAHFVDRETNQRFPVEVNLEGRQQLKPQGWLYLEPANPLPPDRAYFVVIDGLKEASRREPLPKLIAIPVGTTYSPEIIDVRGYHQPLKGAFFRVAANQSFQTNDANLRSISVTPLVPDLRLVPTGNGFEAMGSFKTGMSYNVVLKAGLLSVNEFQLKEDSAWEIKIPGKRPSVIFVEEFNYQRASTGMVRVPFTQVNTEQLTWNLARIPASRFAEVYKRLREFGFLLRASDAGNIDQAKVIVKGNHNLVYDKATGENVYDKTVPLIPQLGLPVVENGEGKIERSMDDQETVRTIEWRATDKLPDLLLLEITGKDSRGRLVGNRVIVSRTDWMMNSVSGTARVFRMDDGKPAPGVRLEKIGTEVDSEAVDTPKIKFTSDTATTDANGQATLADSDADSDSIFLAGPIERPCLLHLGDNYFGSGGDHRGGSGDGVDGVIITDRNVYFPGETVKYQGYIRERKEGNLGMLPDKTVPVRITAGDNTKEVIEEGEKQISAGGAFPGEWKIPTDAYGDYTISVADENIKASVKVAEFRPPPFTSTVDAGTTMGMQAMANVSSMLYHGAPNQRAKVRWKAEWVADNWDDEGSDEESDEDSSRPRSYQLNDLYSPDSPTRGVAGNVLQELQKAGWDTTEEDSNGMVAGVAQGEAVTDENGRVTLKCDCPLPNTAHARFKVYWVVDVTSAVTAQTVRGGTVVRVQTVPQVLAVSLRPVNDRLLALNVASFNSEEARGEGVKAKAELFAIQIKSTKEQISPGFHRYVNIPVFTKVWEGPLVTPGAKDIEVKDAGEYVVRVTAAGIPQVSDTAILAEDEDEIELGVRSDMDLEVSVPKSTYDVGETIPVTIKTPMLGPAILSVEAGDVLHTEQIEIRGNVTTFPLKVDKACAPNIWITVHQIAPAADDGLPGERFGHCRVAVEVPERRLEVRTTLENAKLEPGATARGVVKVSQLGAPIPNAEVLVFAVDESVLQIGKWELPDFKKTFFPQRGWEVKTTTALSSRWTPVAARELSHGQKGFILGDSGLSALMDMAYFRREFKALAYWNPLHKTDGNGEVAFEFKTPDSLTSYRVIAFVQEGNDKFGQNKVMLQVNKPLQVEPVLPAFLRQGDVVLLRTSLRQDYADSDELEVGVKINADLQIQGPPIKRVTVKRGQPIVVNFPVSVNANATRASIGFAAWSARDRQIQDADEHSFAIHPKAVGRPSVVTGVFDRTMPVDVSNLVPPFWKQAEGKADVILSGSSLLPKLTGVYDLLEAQGSTEKLATHILAVTLISDASAFLPLATESKDRMRQRIEDGLKRLLRAEVWSGGLAAWPTDRGSIHPANHFATIEGAWAIRNAAAKFADLVRESTLMKADRWLTQIINQEYSAGDVPPSARCYALMAYAHSATEQDKIEIEGMESAIATLYQNRDAEGLTVQDRAWLALAMHYLKILPNERRTLLLELQKPIDQSLFNPAFFDSQTRAESARLLARSEMEPVTSSGNSRKQIQQAFEKIAASSLDLSTQDNLWLLLLFNSLMKGEVPAQIANRLTPKPPTTSQNLISAGWINVPLRNLAQVFAQPVRSQVPGSYLLRAEVMGADDSSAVADTSFNITREARNLTDRKRTGQPESPWKPGDQILLTYRITTTQQHSHLEFDDQLPACLEVVNPDLPAIAENFKLQVEAGVNQLKLAHQDLRFAHTLLYFDKAPPGVSTYSVLARVNVAGAFTWPATRVLAMYDRRFYASSRADVVHSE